MYSGFGEENEVLFIEAYCLCCFIYTINEIELENKNIIKIELSSVS